MKKSRIILILAFIIIFSFHNISYADENKAILILVDELSMEDIEFIFDMDNFGIGFMNIKMRKPYGDESLYFSIATGRKVGVKSENYKGLCKKPDGTIRVIGFEDMLEDLYKRNNNVEVNMLGEKMGKKGVSYIGDDSSAIIAANKKGNIKSGEIQIKYDTKWLEEKTNTHLSKSDILVLSYNIENIYNRKEILKEYVKQFKQHNIIVISRSVSPNMKYILNNNLTPVIYINGTNKGLLTSSSTKREGIITVEDIYANLLHNNGIDISKAIGNPIKITPKNDPLNLAKILFKKTINMLWIASIFHGIVYSLQGYTAYFIFKNKWNKLKDINIYNSFVIINIFVSLLMGLSNLHINILLYLFMNLSITYIITVHMINNDINIIGLFSTLTYGMILMGIFFYPKLIYNSYIGFNNLFYGARYYGFNNGIMGVLLATSVISYYYIKELLPNKLLDYTICILFFLTNMIALSANYGANTGGFITSAALFLIVIYVDLLNKDFNVHNIILLILIGALIFGINMYFDYYSGDKSHAINFIIRIKNFGFSEFKDMFKVKAKELIKLTLTPPFIIVIPCQIYTLVKLLKWENFILDREIYIILLTSIIGFLLNDTGMITFVYMIHYLISLLIYNKKTKPVN
ncbi:hypothetical protein EDD65_104143 [Keratinibaculum paraultunense]|uniref:Uncharacterized protein n=1 Tax=Keratinibaculum paraultunense TaxID=1278232 RepID=A0A4R3L0Y5_9FIRM|nr:hypothetical protein [Keratinibaculum paraultunense]QQY78979.1 hypothetical protein JL105_07220 [Keratinibaculum paraultunense]TCS90600.1 hypothetical protein EDD65_104143 [Keratinibaculum paraultunense]